jgi:hypothetical protein
MQGHLLTRPEIRDFAGTTGTPNVSVGHLYLETASVIEVILTKGVATLVLANPPAAGGQRPLARRGAADYDCSGGRGRHLRVCHEKRRGMWYGFLGGKDFS